MDGVPSQPQVATSRRWICSPYRRRRSSSCTVSSSSRMAVATSCTSTPHSIRRQDGWCGNCARRFSLRYCASILDSRPRCHLQPSRRRERPGARHRARSHFVSKPMSKTAPLKGGSGTVGASSSRRGHLSRAASRPARTSVHQGTITRIVVTWDSTKTRQTKDRSSQDRHPLRGRRARVGGPPIRMAGSGVSLWSAKTRSDVDPQFRPARSAVSRRPSSGSLPLIRKGPFLVCSRKLHRRRSPRRRVRPESPPSP